MADRGLENPKIQTIWNTAITSYKTDETGEVAGAQLKNIETGETSTLGVKCVFIAIGHTPNTTPFRDKLEMDANGYLIHQEGSRTNMPGVFAAVDVLDPHYRQAVTAAGLSFTASTAASR